ncbi:MAG: filamentous hemagglutinin N-terminal domain-containing protein [Rivularia sp. (in: cyanobacteria)]
MKIPSHCFQNLAVAIFATIAFYASDLSAQIVKDTTLPNNSSITIQDNIKVIEGGTQQGTNLFHSFEQFSVPIDSTAYFNNISNIENIITRITGKSISRIDGIIRANGTANLFLINPNGIVFGENAALNIGGSFLATTASSINFADGTLFSATQPETKPLLTINVPIGLQFGATAASIRNQSQTSANNENNFFGNIVGLQVPIGKSLALIGGNIILENGNLTADSGRIELASVASNSFVNLDSIDKDWIFGYESVDNLGNIQLIRSNIDDSTIGTTVNVSGKNSGGSINLQGNFVELNGNPVRLISATTNNTDAGDITINTDRLVVRNGAQVLAVTYSQGAAGNLTVNASDSVELIGVFNSQDGFTYPSTLSSASFADGNGGNLTINTSRLIVRDGAIVSAQTSARFEDSLLIPATGKGGNLNVNASKSIELIGENSLLSTSTLNSANAGNINISTKQLVVKNEAEITVSSRSPRLPSSITFVGDTNNLGNAGEFNITADSILLDNQGKLISETELANGGNINIELKDLLLLRRNSQISTNAGKAQNQGDGGNININIPNGFLVALPSENSDITANAFTGAGGRVDITATGIFGIQPRSRDELATLLSSNNLSEIDPQQLLTSDITAISQQNPNLNGILTINVQDVEPTRELVELPEIPIDTKISQVCRFRRGNQSQFVFTRRGGLPALPSEALRGDSALGVDWIEGEIGRRGEGERGRKENRIVEANGWVVDDGDIYFVANKSGRSGENFQGAGC